MEYMSLHPCEYKYVHTCVSTCEHGWWGGEQRSTLGVFSACSLSFETGFLTVEFSDSAAPWLSKSPITSYFCLPGIRNVCCHGGLLHGHWGAKLRSSGLHGKATDWAISPLSNFLFKGVITWRWIFKFFSLKFIFHTKYFDHTFPPHLTPPRSSMKTNNGETQNKQKSNKTTTSKQNKKSTYICKW